MIKECGLVCAICADLKSVCLSLCLYHTMSSLYLHFSYNINEERSYCVSYAILSYSHTLRHLTAGKSRVLLQQLALSVGDVLLSAAYWGHCEPYITVCAAVKVEQQKQQRCNSWVFAVLCLCVPVFLGCVQTKVKEEKVKKKER